MKKNNSLLDSILEEANQNPILTEEELREMLYFPLEEEIKEEEKVTEAVCNRIERYQEVYGSVPSNRQLKTIIKEEREKRKLL